MKDRNPVRVLGAIALASTLCIAAAGASTNAPPTIRSITISGNTRTRTDVIRRELLFTEGEPLDTARVAETARNLRRLLFLGDVRVDYSVDSLRADIAIRVQDLYSRAVTPILSGDRDELSYGVVGLDYNFLGKGQIVTVAAAHDAVTGNRGEVYYRVPGAGDNAWAITSQAGVGSEGHLAQLSLTWPYRTLDAAWTAGAAAYSQSRIARLYAAGGLAAKYEDHLEGGSLWFGRSYGRAVKVRPSLRLSISRRRFEPEAGYTYAPTNRRRTLPSARLVIWQPVYETTRFVNDLGRIEDLQLGSWAAARAGISAGFLGSDTSFVFGSLELAPRHKPAASAYTFGLLTAKARYSIGRYWNLTAAAELRTVIRVRDVHTMAFRVRWDAIDRPEDNTQLLLGAFRGLRGYVPRRMDGSRRFLMNLEARPTLRRRPSCVVAGALFFDAGSAWTPGQSSRSIKTSTGAGLRVALPRLYASPILRADLAYAFCDRAWQLWVGLGQYF